jgi:hypothetical protein
MDVRDAIWRAVRAERPGWTVEDLALITGAEEDEIRAYVGDLAGLGFVRAHGPGRYRTCAAAAEQLATPSLDGLERIELVVVLDHGTGTARLLQESRPGAWEQVRDPRRYRGKWLPAGQEQNGRDRMWAAIRVRIRFTRKELQADTACSASSVGEYVHLLLQHRIIKRVNRVGEAEYQLVRDLGPTRPATPDIARKRRARRVK